MPSAAPAASARSDPGSIPLFGLLGERLLEHGVDRLAKLGPHVPHLRRRLLE